MAIMKEPTFIKDVKELVCLAGSFGLNRYSFENATADNPQAEWNVYVDPEAAKIVFNSGVPLRAIGLDVATGANLSKVQLNSLKKSNRKEARIVEKMVRFVESRGHESYCVLIDSMAVAAVLEPSLAILDETDSGLDVDALREVSDGVNALKSSNRSFIIVTHYQRILNYIEPDFVHVLVDGSIVKSGNKDLALDIENNGYEKIISEVKK